jgi:hypothetical protein
MDGIEIDIRRSNKTTPGRSTSVTHRIGDHERKIVSEEKVKLSQAHWDYSALHGKKILKCLHNYNIQLLVNIYTLKKFLLILVLHRRKTVPINIVLFLFAHYSAIYIMLWIPPVPITFTLHVSLNYL